MLFNRLDFALFVGPVYCLFLLIPNRFKTWFLVCASYLFYGLSSARACGILLAVSLICYWGGLWLQRAEDNPRRQSHLLFGLVALIGALLVYFKFVPLIAEYLTRFAESERAGRTDFFLLFVPVGYSYYIFQGIGYLIDVYWRKPASEKLPDFLLFMAFFPKVLMGPIERGSRLLPQIEKLSAFQFDYDRFREGCLLFTWGLFKKMVVAERLAVFVNAVFRYPADVPGLPVAAGLVGFAFQLYADFSGYTDMALGIGKIFGLELTQNFNRPFTSTNIQEYWRRWHISFSSWIADYIFLPLRMSFRSAGKIGLAAALIITFFLVGIWHSTGWTFAIFGVLQGIYMIVSIFTLPARNLFWDKRNQLHSRWLILSRQLVTFCLWTVSLVFFRADSVRQAFVVLKNLVAGANLHAGAVYLAQRHDLQLAAIAVVFMEMVESYIRTPVLFERLITRPLYQRWPAYILLLLFILRGELSAPAQRFFYLAF